MALIEKNAQLRDRSLFVQMLGIRGRFRQFWRSLWARSHPHIGDLPPRMARDAGLSDADLAAHQHRLPSQHMHHPRG